MAELPAAAALSPVIFFLVVAGDCKQKHASVLHGQRKNNRFCHDMDVRQQLSAAFTVSAFDVQVAVAMSRVLLIHGPLPKFAQLILMTRQAVIKSSFKDGTLQNAPACMPDQVKVKHTGQPVIILGFSSN